MWTLAAEAWHIAPNLKNLMNEKTKKLNRARLEIRELMW